MSTELRRFRGCTAFEDLCARADRRGCNVGLVAGDELLERETHPHRELTQLEVCEGRTLLCRVPIDSHDLAAASRMALRRLGWAAK